MSNLQLNCHCGANKFSFPVTIPLDKTYTDLHLCLCSDCRLQNGTFVGSFVKAPSAPFDPESPPDSLTIYSSSDIGARYFCSTCSTQLFFQYADLESTNSENKRFWLCTGGLELPNGGKFGIESIGFVKSTPDGGLASWSPGEEICTTFEGKLTDEEIHALEATAMSQFNPLDTFEGRCQCSNIKLKVSRQTGKPQELPPHAWSDNTDLVIPCWTPKEDQPPIDEKNPWWIRDPQEPGMGKRFLGGLCACKSCRLIAGTEIQSWVFIPTICIEVILPGGETTAWPTKEQLLNDEKFKSLIGTYKSTTGDPGVLRGFCKTCGANLFWDGLTRKNFVDISAGLFTGRGIREEAWIEWWTERVSFVEDADGRHDYGKLLEKGLKEWKGRLGGKV
ncbi:hypothetical protein H072_208 [Dactylellina haptotyla CBS 200.50]|uniref:CENP-V/GFA domain-containing protein n=1 Tax=Dactylellina haptotyla (strain CBS 200.50) TaxID=1284197 RepID=S8C227_DACHA|nr:hypothetical protein H072_208 [Dactylellina haptotyla CBS 200.50]